MVEEEEVVEEEEEGPFRCTIKVTAANVRAASPHARANGGASALLPAAAAAAASCAHNSQGRRATVEVGAHARRGAGEGGARRAAHMSRAPPPEARGVAARGERAATPRAGHFAAVYVRTDSCGALSVLLRYYRPRRSGEEPVTCRQVT